MSTTQQKGAEALAAFAAKYGLKMTRCGFVEIEVAGEAMMVDWTTRNNHLFYAVLREDYTSREMQLTPEAAARFVGWCPAGEAPEAPTPEAAPAPALLAETYRDCCRDLLVQLEAMQADRDAARRERDDALARLDDANRWLRAIKRVLAGAMGEAP